MSFYLFITCIASLSAFCYAKSKNPSSVIVFAVIAFSSLFLPLALRYNIGTDYKNYVHHINDYMMYGQFSKTRFEIGWLPVILSTKRFGVQSFFIIPAFFSILILFICIPRKYFYIAVPAYIAVAYPESFSLVRQAFAVAIFLLSAKNYIEKKRIRALFFLGMAVCFHKSSIVLLPLLFLSELQWKIFSPSRNIVLLFGMVLFLRVTNFAAVLMEKVIGNTMYAIYVGGRYDRAAQMGSGLGVLLRVILFSLILFSVRRNCMNGKRQYVLVSLFVFSLAVGHILATQIHIFNRIPSLFSPLYAYFAVTIASSKSKYRRIALYGFFAILLILFVKTLQVSLSSYTGGLGIVPYKSLLSR